MSESKHLKECRKDLNEKLELSICTAFPKDRKKDAIELAQSIENLIVGWIVFNMKDEHTCPVCRGKGVVERKS